MRATRQEGTFTAPGRPGEAADCVRITELRSRVGDKWTLLVIRVLGSGPMRFNAHRRGIGDISQTMLATTLRGLGRDGFVVRTVTPTMPPQVEHGLTDLGRRLLAPVCALARLTIAKADSIEEAPRPHAAREDGGLRTGGARDFSAP